MALAAATPGKDREARAVLQTMEILRSDDMIE